MKKVLKWVGILFLAVIILSAVSGGGEEETVTEVESKPAQETKAPEKKEEPKKEKKAAAGMGDVLKVGGVEFQVKGKSSAANVGGEYGQNAQGKYLILDVAVKNNGKEPLMVDGSFFKIKANGAEYEADTTAAIYANKAGNAFFLENVNPGLTLNGKVVFDLPTEMIESQDMILNVQTGMFGTEQGQINLK
jgi:hypothetical protein